MSFFNVLGNFACLFLMCRVTLHVFFVISSFLFIFFKKINLSEVPSECQIVWIQIRLDPGLNCLQRLSVFATSEERVKSGFN